MGAHVTVTSPPRSTVLLCDLDDLHRWAVVEIRVMGHAVTDVGVERGQQSVDHGLGAHGTDDGQRGGLEGHDPARGDHIVQIGDVVAVQMGQHHCSQGAGVATCPRQSHEHAAPGVAQELVVAPGDQGGWSGPVRIGQRAPRPQQRDGQSLGHR